MELACVRHPNEDLNEANELPMDNREVEINQGNVVFEICPIIKIFNDISEKREPSVKVLKLIIQNSNLN